MGFKADTATYQHSLTSSWNRCPERSQADVRPFWGEGVNSQRNEKIVDVKWLWVKLGSLTQGSILGLLGTHV